MEARRWPAAATLYYAAGNRIDQAHTEHIRDVQRIRTEPLDTWGHNVIQFLVAEGRFGDVLLSGLG